MTTVVKLGGSVLEPWPAPEMLAALVRLARGGEVAVVHGGGKALTALLHRLGLGSEFRKGLRVTDAATLDAAVMALAGTVNTRLVAALNAAGVCAVGLTGADAVAVQAERQAELGAVGVITAAAARLWRTLLDAGYTPVLASLAVAPHSADLLNVNADQFAAAVAAALGAERLIFCTDVEGVLDGSGAPLHAATLDELRALAAAGALRGGMLPKAAACAAALEAGVAEVAIIGPRAAASLDAGVLAGTEVRR
ncbi:MAG: acetylglutamate kinase [Terriglobales bacterium]